ncbi:MAG: acyl-CoA dehydrogenase [Actinomycetospora chiangmaiensis]|nr:acyl-CoA dehydrogenase [Actinomycetospora chiangmaiensis]
MDDTFDILAATTTRLYADLFPVDRIGGATGWSEAAWRALDETGLPLSLVSEERGGVGLEPATALGLVRVASRSVGALPLGETMAANWLLAQADLPPSEGPATLAASRVGIEVLRSGKGRDWTLAGTVAGVPWGRTAQTLALLLAHEGETWVARIPRSGWSVTEGRNLADLPRDDLTLRAALSADEMRPLPASWNAERLRATGAALRTQEMAGALESILDLTVRYANERVQFGKPIGKQQAVQQQIAVLAGQAAAAGAAAALAADALGLPDGTATIAAAKVRAGEAAGIGAAIAHQVHGAIGITAEHPLHVFTKRLWAWRDDFGSERVWSLYLGRLALAAGADGFWPFVTDVGARTPAEAV